MQISIIHIVMNVGLLTRNNTDMRPLSRAYKGQQSLKRQVDELHPSHRAYSKHTQFYMYTA